MDQFNKIKKKVSGYPFICVIMAQIFRIWPEFRAKF
jgi:hypothetical protein